MVIPRPADPSAFGTQLRQTLRSARDQAAQALGGFDNRRLVKLELQVRLDPAELRRISKEIEVVSQEDDSVILAFATEAALTAFEAKLTSLALGGSPSYRHILFALRGFDRWTEDDR